MGTIHQDDRAPARWRANGDVCFTNNATSHSTVQNRTIRAQHHGGVAPLDEDREAVNLCVRI